MTESVLTTLMPGFAGTTLPAWLAVRLRAGLGGVCLFAPNIVSAVQLRELTTAILAANPRALIALDEEGGDITRLFAGVGSPSPGNAVLGRIDDLSLTREDARRIGWQLRQAGVNLDFAPSVDVNSCSDNPVIGVRSFARRGRGGRSTRGRVDRRSPVDRGGGLREALPGTRRHRLGLARGAARGRPLARRAPATRAGPVRRGGRCRGAGRDDVAHPASSARPRRPRDNEPQPC